MRLLQRLRTLPQPVRLGIVGIGSMGRGVVDQAHLTPGFVPAAVADLDLNRAVAAAAKLGRAWRTVNTEGELADALRAGVTAVCQDGALVAGADDIDALVECSSSVVEGAEFALTALQRHTPTVMMNAEADLMFGPLLWEEARRHGTTYTSADGDQPGVIARLVDELTLWGFDLVMCGNIKGFLRRSANPEDIKPEAAKRNLDPQMCAGYTDGSKLAIEQALLCNAFGLRVDRPGMHGPRLPSVYDVFEAFDFPALHAGGPVADYILGAQPDGGVFAVGHRDEAYARGMLQYLKMGDGPYYLFYRPYHLCHVETMATIAAAVLDHEALLAPEHGFRANVYAYAKTDLPSGTVLDGIGGFACYGLVENCQEHPVPGVPIGLSDGLRLKRAVRQDERLGTDDVDWPAAHPGLDMYRQACALGGERCP
jgi:predicted homoserine dehydrogenase-like protein